jgi:hypothetical protein
MPEVQAEVIARRYAAMLEDAGWRVTLQPGKHDGVRRGPTWLEPARMWCWVNGWSADGTQIIQVGWRTVTAGAPGTTRYLGGQLLSGKERVRLRTIDSLNELIRNLQQ